MQHGALDDALEGGGGVNLPAVLHDEGGAIIVEVVREVPAQLFEIDLAGRHHLGRVLVVRQREQQVFKRGVLVLAVRGELQGAFEGAFEAGGEGGHLGVLILAFFRALERMLVLARKVHDLGHFRFGHFERINAADAHPVIVDMQHDPGRLLARLVEEVLQDQDHELHGGVIVVQQEDAVERWFPGLRLRPRGDAELSGGSGCLFPVSHGVPGWHRAERSRRPCNRNGVHPALDIDPRAK